MRVADPERQEVERPAVAPGLRRSLSWFVAGGAAAIVGFVTGAVALFFTLFPGLKPFSATTLSARVHVVTVERAVTRDQWRWRVAAGNAERHQKLVEQDLAAAQAPKNQRCRVLGAAAGDLIYVSTEAHGFKRHQLTIRAALYDAVSKQRVPDPEGYRDLAKVPVDAPTAFSVEEIWLFDPGPETKHWFVRVELYDPHDHLLDVADSNPFPAISAREEDLLPKYCLSRP